MSGPSFFVYNRGLLNILDVHCSQPLSKTVGLGITVALRSPPNPPNLDHSNRTSPHLGRSVMTGNDDADKGVCLVLFVVKRLDNTYLPIHDPKMLVANNHYAV